jgi:prevent-host-death family protein
MSKYGVADAKNRLSALIDRALKGEEVVITRHGLPIVELKSVAKSVRRITQADVDWLKAHQVGKKRPRKDAGTLLSEMRDKEYE